MKFIQELDFMKLAKVYALHESWTPSRVDRKQIYIVHNQKEAESITPQENKEVISLQQIAELPVLGHDVEIYLSRLVVGVLLTQGKSAIEYLTETTIQQSNSFYAFKANLTEQLKKEKQLHASTAQSMQDHIHVITNKLKEMESLRSELSKELKKYELLMNSEKSKKKKDVIDKLCQENEELRRTNEALEVRLESYQLLEEHT